MKTRIMYIELKSNSNDRGPARIGRVQFSKWGSSVYYQGRRFETLKGSGVSGNYVDVETGDEYWISGCKKNGQDRHWAGSGPVEIDDDVREEYWTEIRGQPESIDKRVV
ncbi:MAG: 1-deoxy-D-xylulose-5-phosphate synthase [Phycisphaerales bacterium]